MICLPTAELRFSENQTPISCIREDFYFSASNAIAECEHVFIGGNRLLQRWQETDSFTIAELGFGAARNFLVTAQRWLQHTTTGTLHYFSIEHAPLDRLDLTRVMQRYTLGDALKQELIQHYPAPIRGFHPITIAQGRIRLVLIFDEAQLAINQLEQKADAWFLDGFSPACNADAWQDNILQSVFRHTNDLGTVATYSAASSVRKGLQSAGFTVLRKPGFGGKREMLCASKPKTTTSQKVPAEPPFYWKHSLNKNQSTRTANIIGAGLAGCCLAYALSQRNWRINLYDSAAALATGASGNSAAILMPRLNLNHDLSSQLSCSGYQYSVNWIHQLQQDGLNFEWLHCGGLQFGRDQQQNERMLKIAQQENFPASWLQLVDVSEAESISGCSVQNDGWYFPDAACINLSSLCRALITAAGNRVQLHYKTVIHSLEHATDKSHYDPATATLYTASDQAVILACGHHSDQFEQTQHLPVLKKRGQVTSFRATEARAQPKCILNGDGYLTPAMNGMHTLGASFITNDSNTEVRDSEHLLNLDKLQRLLPDFPVPDIKKLQGRTGIRAVSPDRLPMVGPISRPLEFEKQYAALALGNRRKKINSAHYYPNLYVLSGFSSRGLSWIPICAEHLAAKLNSEPGLLPASISDAIHPNRFLFKALKQKLNKPGKHRR